jgi:hypothetical protein
VDKIVLTGAGRVGIARGSAVPGEMTVLTVSELEGDTTGELVFNVGTQLVVLSGNSTSPLQVVESSMASPDADKMSVISTIVYSTSSLVADQCGFFIAEGASVYLPSNVVFQNVRAIFRGMMSGVKHLSAGGSAMVQFYSTGAAEQVSGSAVVGLFDFTDIRVDNTAVIELYSSTTDQTNVTTSGDIYFSQTTTLNIYGTASLKANEVKFDTNVVVDGNGRGYGRGVAPPGCASPPSTAGGSHGGSTEAGGVPCGSYRLPLLMGSGGGETAANLAGFGGAALRIEAASAVMDGVVRMDGSNGYTSCNNRAGGGAGGSILLQLSGSLSGSGSLTAKGGQGSVCGS